MGRGVVCWAEVVIGGRRSEYVGRGGHWYARVGSARQRLLEVDRSWKGGKMLASMGRRGQRWAKVRRGWQKLAEAGRY